MKIIALMSAGLIAAATFAAPAAAQMNEHHDRAVVVKESRTVHNERRGDYRPHVRRVCRVTYRHHHRVRTCRTVRR